MDQKPGRDAFSTKDSSSRKRMGDGFVRMVMSLASFTLVRPADAPAVASCRVLPIAGGRPVRDCENKRLIRGRPPDDMLYWQQVVLCRKRDRCRNEARNQQEERCTGEHRPVAVVSVR